MISPIAVLISDVHYNLSTLELADAAMRQAITKANELEVPLIVAGDLHDTKANMRAECVNAMLKTFSEVKECYILRGNHDSINERSEHSSLKFLMQYPALQLIERSALIYINNSKLTLLAYHADADKLRAVLNHCPLKTPIIMHQGIQESNAGDYIQDKSAITKADVAGFRVISGHYHARQTIELPDGGKWDYIGNPYTLNFGEAKDPEKGYQILMDDGSLKFVSTNLRKHVVLKMEKANYDYWQITGKYLIDDVRDNDLILIKVEGTKEELSGMSKEQIAKILGFSQFRLEYIFIDSKIDVTTQSKSKPELLDAIIDSEDVTAECKIRLKQAWRDLCE